LLTNLTHADIQKLQSAESGSKGHYILQNDLPRAWEHLRTLKSSRIDIVLDNAGYELFTVCFNSS